MVLGVEGLWYQTVNGGTVVCICRLKYNFWEDSRNGRSQLHITKKNDVRLMMVSAVSLIVRSAHQDHSDARDLDHSLLEGGWQGRTRWLAGRLTGV